jgi:hypothetical protein
VLLLTISDPVHFEPVLIIRFVRNKCFFNAPVLLLNDVADPLSGFEVPALSVLAEKVKLNIR